MGPNLKEVLIMAIEIDAWVYLIPIAGAIGLLVAALLTRSIFRKDTGTPDMEAIGDAIREGAMAYLARQYKTIAIISVILGIVIAIGLRWEVGIAFLLGAFCSALSGYIGMYVSVKSNIRTASAARRNLNEALQTSFRGGAVSGISVVTLSLLGVAGIFFLYLLFIVPTPDPASVPVGYTVESWQVVEVLSLAVGYAFGASFAALFAQLGGGIYTKAADVGADLVGKVEAGIPEDDPRNPAVIADLVGDNVGDCAGRGADLFESTAAENIGAMILGAAIFGITGNIDWVFFPLVVRAFGLLASLVGIMMVKLRSEDEEPMKALNRGYYVSAVLAAIGFYIITDFMLGAWQFFAC
jgi:K(+)-stimulated pyrophosphate-energized sodium pump